MKILLITETLHVGGAETFVVRLANKLAAQHDVDVLNLYPELSKQELINKLSRKVKLVNVNIRGKKLLSKIDTFLFRIGIDFSFKESLFIKTIKKNIEQLTPEVVHSHLFKADYYVSKARSNTKHKFNHIATNHGDYLLFETKSPAGVLNYAAKLNFTLRSLDTMVMISEGQVEWLGQKMKASNFKLHHTKVINGYEFNSTELDFNKPDFKKHNAEFVFGMVARGIKQKGWESLINAFKSLNASRTKLVLIGEGPELDRLKNKHENDTSILFAGYKHNPIEYIKYFDVCLLPTYYEAESLPTVIIEYLACKKPIITTDIGEIKYMLTSSDNSIAGLLVKYNSAGVDGNDLLEKMKLIYSNADERERMAKQTDSAFKKFDMNECVLSYLDIYSGNEKQVD